MPAKSLAEGVIKGIINKPDVSDLTYSTEPSTESKAPIKGTYRQSDVHLEMRGIALGQGKQAWVVVVLYKQGSPGGQAAADRTLSSITLEGSPCPERKEVAAR